MKKTIVLLAALTTLFCSIAFADPAYIGTWANVQEPGENETVVSAFRLFPDQTAFFVSAAFPDGKQNASICSWESVDDTSFRLLDGSGQEVGSFYMLNKNRIEDSDRNMFVKISFETVPEIETPSPSPHGNLQDGILIDPGQYISWAKIFLLVITVLNMITARSTSMSIKIQIRPFGLASLQLRKAIRFLRRSVFRKVPVWISVLSP